MRRLPASIGTAPIRGERNDVTMIWTWAPPASGTGRTPALRWRGSGQLSSADDGPAYVYPSRTRPIRNSIIAASRAGVHAHAREQADKEEHNGL